ncbi:hypothetical protein H5410_011314 [Solanum commersonii]|uniref:Uncharacterized protein n=1 Tax=Solanum commersonii TaxID=4109 RepID=A0A9J6AN68_SOLCO|nr:hypothetical protein H5410_011314 [Solanum commersonii]
MVFKCRPRPGCRLGEWQIWYQSTEFKSPRESMKSIVRGRPYRRNVEEQELPNAPKVQSQGEVTNNEFR